MTEIVNDWPPNIDAIRRFLPVTRNNIFAYDGKIYSPGSKTLPPELIAHEQVHFEQQSRIGVLNWWDNFLIDKKFRLAQEIPAHQAEYRHMLENAPSRQVRRRVKTHGLKMLAKRLSDPMYGGIITMAEAKRRIAT